LEIVKRSPFVLLDGAHNVDSARRLVQAVKASFTPRRTLLVVGLNGDKDIGGFAGALMDGLPDADVIATRASTGRAVPPERVAQAFAEYGIAARTAPGVAAAVDDALAEATAADLVLVTGSLYVVAEARAWLLGILPDGAFPTTTGGGAAPEERQV
jgi:dihydrofolate synthase/folylpolyglutamate synthase